MKLAQLQDHTYRDASGSFYVSFADLMMLLSVFFVMLLSMSKIELGAFEKVRTGITGTTAGTLVELADDLKKIVTGDPGVPGVKVRLAKDGVRLDMDTAALFATGSAALKDDALTPITPLFKKILGTQYTLDIEGHTDDVRLFRVSEDEIETNWSLSGRRASAMVNHLLDMGYRKSRIRIVGYADTKPIIKPNGLSGRQLNKARSRNRRVSILVK